MTEFTRDDAIAIQHQQLLGWKKVLKPEYYKILREWCESSNNKSHLPEFVVRGIDMDNFIHNTLISGHDQNNILNP